MASQAGTLTGTLAGTVGSRCPDSRDRQGQQLIAVPCPGAPEMSPIGCPGARASHPRSIRENRPYSTP
jgi:hypothetical protein